MVAPDRHGEEQRLTLFERFVQQTLWLLGRLTPLALLDILLVTLIFYGLLMLIRGTQADQLVRGVLVLILASAAIGSFLDLTVFSWLLQATVPALLIAIPVIFQPELRRALEQLGRSSNFPIPHRPTPAARSWPRRWPGPARCWPSGATGG